MIARRVRVAMVHSAAAAFYGARTRQEGSIPHGLAAIRAVEKPAAELSHLGHAFSVVANFAPRPDVAAGCPVPAERP
jgi:hypothetical protein